MNWQKRGTWHNYDTNSGHSCLIGYRTGKLIGMLVYLKQLAICNNNKKYNLLEDEEHNCLNNYCSRSSKTMENSAVLEVVVIL